MMYSGTDKIVEEKGILSKFDVVKMQIKHPVRSIYQMNLDFKIWQIVIFSGKILWVLLYFYVI